VIIYDMMCYPDEVLMITLGGSGCFLSTSP
jgi:hypothetical protein